jgi:hypothetical protein
MLGEDDGGLNLDNFEDAGGMVSFDDAHSQLLYSHGGGDVRSELAEEEGGDVGARERGGEEFRLSLLSGGEVDGEDETASAERVRKAPVRKKKRQREVRRDM